METLCCSEFFFSMYFLAPWAARRLLLLRRRESRRLQPLFHQVRGREKKKKNQFLFWIRASVPEVLQGRHRSRTLKSCCIKQRKKSAAIDTHWQLGRRRGTLASRYLDSNAARNCFIQYDLISFWHSGCFLSALDRNFIFVTVRSHMGSTTVLYLACHIPCWIRKKFEDNCRRES